MSAIVALYTLVIKSYQWAVSTCVQVTRETSDDWMHTWRLRRWTGRNNSSWWSRPMTRLAGQQRRPDVVSNPSFTSCSLIMQQQQQQHWSRPSARPCEMLVTAGGHDKIDDSGQHAMKTDTASRLSRRALIMPRFLYITPWHILPRTLSRSSLFLFASATRLTDWSRLPATLLCQRFYAKEEFFEQP